MSRIEVKPHWLRDHGDMSRAMGQLLDRVTYLETVVREALAELTEPADIHAATAILELSDDEPKPAVTRSSLGSKAPELAPVKPKRCVVHGDVPLDMTKDAECDICAPPAPPIPIILHCPECRTRHIDEGDFKTKVHHTHSCQGCGLTWRPAVVPTVGVQFLPGFKNERSGPPAPVAAITIETKSSAEP